MFRIYVFIDKRELNSYPLAPSNEWEWNSFPHVSIDKSESNFYPPVSVDDKVKLSSFTSNNERELNTYYFESCDEGELD
jgi:hypothetical protein